MSGILLALVQQLNRPLLRIDQHRDPAILPLQTRLPQLRLFPHSLHDTLLAKMRRIFRAVRIRSQDFGPFFHQKFGDGFPPVFDVGFLEGLASGTVEEADVEILAFGGADFELFGLGEFEGVAGFDLAGDFDDFELVFGRTGEVFRLVGFRGKALKMWSNSRGYLGGTTV